MENISEMSVPAALAGLRVIESHYGKVHIGVDLMKMSQDPHVFASWRALRDRIRKENAKEGYRAIPKDS